ncbi:MAG: endonuclease [Thermoleophilia bacterium]|nr:endonuclease [Thermoleophilia bacterium]
MGDVARPAPMGTDTRIRIAGGGRLPGQARLPELAGVEPRRDPLPDAIGRPISSHPAIAYLAAAVGAGIGAHLLGPAPMRAAGGLALGAAAGFVGATLVARAVDLARHRSGPASTGFVAGGGGGTPQAGAPGEHLRVLDWNVRELIGPDGTVREDGAALDAIAETVRREHPDVLVLQEVSTFAALGGYHDDIDELKTRLGATDAVLVPNAVGASGKTKGGAVLTFGGARIEDARGLHHPDPEGSSVVRRAAALVGTVIDHTGGSLPSWWPSNYEPRTTTDAIVRTAGGTDVRVLGMHLSSPGSRAGDAPGSTEVQERQLVPVADTIDAWHGPTILAGDFNVTGGTPAETFEAQVLGSAGLRNAAAEAGTKPGSPASWSFPALAPARNIDRVYVSKDVQVRDAHVLNDATTRQGSDHVPVVADLVVAPAASD